MTVQFVVYGNPAPAGSKTAGVAKNGRTFVRDSSKRSYPWKQTVAQTAGVAMAGRILLEGPLRLTLEFVVPRPKGHYGARGLRPSAPAHPTVKPDVLKLARAVEDALSGICYRDDAQIVDEHLTKRYGEPAAAHITVALITDTLSEGATPVTETQLERQVREEQEAHDTIAASDTVELGKTMTVGAARVLEPEDL